MLYLKIYRQLCLSTNDRRDSLRMTFTSPGHSKTRKKISGLAGRSQVLPGTTQRNRQQTTRTSRQKKTTNFMPLGLGFEEVSYRQVKSYNRTMTPATTTAAAATTTTTRTMTTTRTKTPTRISTSTRLRGKGSRRVETKMKLPTTHPTTRVCLARPPHEAAAYERETSSPLKTTRRKPNSPRNEPRNAESI